MLTRRRLPPEPSQMLAYICERECGLMAASVSEHGVQHWQLSQPPPLCRLRRLCQCCGSSSACLCCLLICCKRCILHLLRTATCQGDQAPCMPRGTAMCEESQYHRIGSSVGMPAAGNQATASVYHAANLKAFSAVIPDALYNSLGQPWMPTAIFLPKNPAEMTMGAERNAALFVRKICDKNPQSEGAQACACTSGEEVRGDKTPAAQTARP